MSKPKKIPMPDCQLGYTTEQLESILRDRLKEFNTWMVGQTIALCDGRSYNHNTKEYEDTGCGPHGLVVYSWDLSRFLDGRAVVD